jgi:glycosyltransferase involved in cell wall biosynthesis
MTAITLSVVIPAFNERGNVAEVHARLTDIVAQLGEPCELLFVDDGSTDDTADVVRSLPEGNPAVRLVSLSRNFGHQTAITAGIDLSVGDAVVIMDGDLQHPPETVLEMVRLWRAGADVVYGVRSEVDAERYLKRRSAELFYRFLDRMTDIAVPVNAADFRLLDRRVVDALGSMREDDRYLRGMIAWLGFRQTQVEFERPARQSGESKYTFARMRRLATDALIGFSNRPLQLATNVGFLFSLLAVVAGVFAIVSKIFGGSLVPGWASVSVLVAFIGGVQLLVLGVFGEYLGRVHTQAKGRPLYVVRDLEGFVDERVPRPSRAVLPVATRREPTDEPPPRPLQPGSAG